MGGRLEASLQSRMDHLFGSNPELGSAVQSVVKRYPDTLPIFERVIRHFQLETEPHRATKRIKTEHQIQEHDTGKNGMPGIVDEGFQDSKSVKKEASSEALLTVKDLSFIMPVRKKLSMSITEDSLIGCQGDIGSPDVKISFADIALIAVLPVPEKAVRQHNFCIFRKQGDETIVFTVPDVPPKSASGPAMNDSYAATLKQLIKQTLNSVISNLQVTEPSTTDFASAILQSHRKNEQATHLVAHRGSKEGYLFFLPEGLVYGFKRPLLYIPLQRIVSVTYNDILQRTFNLTIAVKQGDKDHTKAAKEEEEEEEDEIEFSMIDTAEHDAVDKYIRKYRLSNASLAEERRAKVGKNGKVQEERESEISRAAEAIAGTVTGKEVGSSDEEEDADFRDDASHSGSTIASDESDAENSDEAGEIDIEEETDEEAE